MSTSLARATCAAVFALVVTAFNPGSARADDAARIRNLETEIQKLRTQLGEQDRRIQRLEAELERRGAAVPPVYPVSKSPQVSGPLPRYSPEAWGRIAKGMTQEEVVKILGEPSAVEAVDNLKSLIYLESTADGDSVNGHVNLKDGSVVAIKKPTKAY